MVHFFTGIVLLFLDLSLICGQTVEGTVLGGEEETNLNVTYEDKENFQDQETYHHQYKSCDEIILVNGVIPFCWSAFNKSMVELGSERWCDWKTVLRHYNTLTMCAEHGSEIAQCHYPNHMVQGMFLNVHEQYFSSCVHKEGAEPLRDAPPSVLFTLTLLPISIIPVLVYRIIRKSGVRD